MRKSRYGKVLRSLNYALVIFLLVAFVTTCCMLLFLNTLSHSLGIEFTHEHIRTAAGLTFGNVVLISVLFTAIDTLRRKRMVERPVKQIVDAAERIMQGDFTARVRPIKGMYSEDNFNQIIDCFNRMAQELSGTETLRTDFIANVSHELKTPLSVIRNYGTLLQQPNLSREDRLAYATTVSETADRLAELITNILRLNKLENQQIYPTGEIYDLSEQLCQCILQFENVWDKKNIQMDIQIEESVKICADEKLLSLVWNNLLSNAFKFTNEGGQVSVSMWADEEYATVRIADTGCGMSPEVGAHIFEKFYQGDHSHAMQGNGLGLALVKRVMDISSGEICVESTVEKGSTFTVKMRR